MAIRIKNKSQIENIKKADDIKKVNPNDYAALAQEIREFLIEKTAENGGHLASNLGAVELTMAIFLAFDLPKDKVIWDVGHQSYTHKILSGRKDAFDDLRKFGGIAGFPKTNESPCDAFNTGHSSTSISAALGMAQARDLKNEKHSVVAVIGDGAMTGGMAFEGLNNAAMQDNNLLIILNDNDMSIDRPVGALSHYIAKMSTSKRYNNMRYKTYQFMRRHHMIGDSGKGIVLRFNNSVKSLLTGQQNIFEGLNIRYFGPFDGHNVVKLVKTFNDVKDMNGPKIIPLHTKKGKGYEAAENDPTTWHAPGRFDESTGERIKSNNMGKPIKYQDVFGKTLVELAGDNDKIVGITAAMPGGTSMSMLQEAHPERTFDVGISEGHAVTFAGGLAKEGLHPFVAIYSSFLQRGYDNIIHDVAIAGLPVTFCIDRGGLVGEDGVTHHGLFDLAYLRCIPGMTVSAPINEHDLRNLMYTSQLDGMGPFAIRYPRGNGVLVDWHNEMKAMPVGQGKVLRRGKKVAVMSIGNIGNNVISALDTLKKENDIEVTHCDMVFLKPIDEQLVKNIAESHRHIITVEDGTVVGGLGSAVAEIISALGCTCSVTRLGIQDDFIDQGTVLQQQCKCGIDVKSICDTVKNFYTED